MPRRPLFRIVTPRQFQQLTAAWLKLVAEQEHHIGACGDAEALRTDVGNERIGHHHRLLGVGRSGQVERVVTGPQVHQHWTYKLGHGRRRRYRVQVNVVGIAPACQVKLADEPGIVRVYRVGPVAQTQPRPPGDLDRSHDDAVGRGRARREAADFCQTQPDRERLVRDRDRERRQEES